MSRNPEGRGSIPRLGSRRSSLISIEHAELLRSTPSLVQCCVWLVTMALHVHCGLGQLSPLPTSGDDKWVAAKHCGRAKRSRISDTHRLRASFQFRYINNQSLLYSHSPNDGQASPCLTSIPLIILSSSLVPSYALMRGTILLWEPSHVLYVWS